MQETFSWFWQILSVYVVEMATGLNAAEIVAQFLTVRKSIHAYICLPWLNIHRKQRRLNKHRGLSQCV